MAFPALVLQSGGQLHSNATGTPVNGNNTFDISMDPNLIDNIDWFTFDVYPQGASVTGASYVSVSGDKRQVTINFTQTGLDQALVRAVYTHSSER